MFQFFEENNKITLRLVKRTNPFLLKYMKIHYSHPNGFVGRNICYLVEYNNYIYGAICGGSATLNLPGRDEFFGFKNKKKDLLCVINNTFYHIEPHKETGKYPIRNFTFKVLELFVEIIARHWKQFYGQEVIGFESLVELPRTGELYKRSGWSETGVTKGFTCKRIAGIGTDSWSGKRIWNILDLKPKKVFCLKCNT